MDLADLYAVDDEKATKGVWFRITGKFGELAIPLADLKENGGPPSKAPEVLLASSDGDMNPEVGPRLAELTADFRSALSNGGRLRRDASAKIEATVLAEHVLLDWRNVIQDGAELPCTLENKIAALERWPRFRRLIQSASASLEPYRPKLSEEETGGKNS